MTDQAAGHKSPSVRTTTSGVCVTRCVCVSVCVCVCVCVIPCFLGGSLCLFVLFLTVKVNWDTINKDVTSVTELI